jgi:hypothetical protein
MGENHLIRHTKHEKSKDLVHNISKSTIDSNLFSIVLRMCNLTDLAKSHVSSVRLGFTYRTPPHFDQSKKITMLRIKVNVNKHSFLLPQDYGLSLIPKTRTTSPFSLRKSWLSM